MRRLDLIVVGTSLVLWAGCGAPQYSGAEAVPDLLVACEPSCFVYVDGSLALRAAPSGRVSLEPGSYRIALVEPGHLTARYDVTIPRRGVELVHRMWPVVPETDEVP